MKSIDSSSSYFRTNIRKIPFYIAAFGTALVFMGLLSLFVMPGTAHAQSGGGVGSGGSGGASGSGDEAHWTNRGWGWVIYDAGGAGPTDGFRNGYNWASAQATCQSAGATQVYANIVLDNFGKGMVYDYKSTWEGFSARFATGTVVDKGKATAISTATAQNAFNSLPGYGVSTAGYTFGENVGWFCYNYSGPSTVTVQMHVFLVDSSGNKLSDVGGMPTVTCEGSNPTTNGSGFATFTANVGEGFCIRMDGPGPAGASGPFVRPWGEGYGNLCPTAYGPSNLQDHCPQGTYECQVAGTNAGVQPCGSPNDLDRGWDGGYDLIYVMDPVISYNCPLVPDGPIYTVNLPNAGKPGPSSSPSGTTSDPNDTYYYTKYSNKSRVDGVDDISVGGDNVQIDYYGGDDGDQNVDLDYRKFWDKYYYDENQAQVRYRSYYDRYNYEASNSPSSSTDNNGDGDTNDPGEKQYSWVFVGKDSDQLGSSQTENGPLRGPCDYRKFEFDTPQFDNVNWDDNEEPKFVFADSNTNVTYIPNTEIKDLRRPNWVNNMPVTIEIILYRNGNPTPYPYGMYSADPSCTNQFLADSRFDTPQSSLSGGSAWGGGFDTDSVDCWRARIPLLQAGDYACVTVSLPFARGQMDNRGDVVAGSTSGTRATPTGSTYESYGCTSRLVDKPYFTVRNGDIIAGSNFRSLNSSCSPTPDSMIEAWNRDDKTPNGFYGNSRYGGAGTQLAAYALGSIRDFVSAATRTTPGPRKGLSFANTPGAGNYNHGGEWDSSNIGCMYDFFADFSGNNYTSGTAIDSLASGAYKAGGNVVIPASTLALGKQVTIFVEGNVAITGDITKDTGTYTDIKDIPSLRIIARNIYIAPKVERLSAILVAQPDSANNGGYIYTCSDPDSIYSDPSDADMASGDCRDDQLIVEGAVLTRKIYFLRTKGSLRNSNINNDYSSDGDRSVSERFIFGPSAWLGLPGNETSSRPPYQAFTELPPIL
jgi:hypothetical protein